MQKMSITMIAILLFVQILSNGFAQIPNTNDDKTLDTDVEIPSLTSARNNTSCGSNSSLTDLWASTDSSTWGTWTNAVYGYYDVNCTVIGNDYTLEATIEITSQQTANGSAAWSSYSFWNWSETNNHEYMSEAWSNLTAGTYCVNATLWDVTSGTSTYVDSDYPCFTLTNSSGSGGNNTGGNNTGGNNTGGNNTGGNNTGGNNTGGNNTGGNNTGGNNTGGNNTGGNNTGGNNTGGNNTGGNNTGGNNTNSNCGNDSNLTDLIVWTDATTYTVGDNVLGNFFVNCTINGETYKLDYEVIEFNTNIVYSDGVWNWTEQNNWEAFNPIWIGLPAGEYCIHSTLEILTSTTTYNFVDYEATCFDILNSTGGNNTGGNNNGGNNQTNPLMPIINCTQIAWNASMNVTIDDCWNQTNSFWFFFNQSGAVVWIDPVVAVGYDYTVYNGPWIVSIDIPLGYGDDIFDLYYFGTNGWYDSNIDIYGGVAYTFSTPVERMSIRGIEASELLDPNDPNAFVTGLTFQNNGTVLMTMTPVTENYTIPICGNDPSLTDLMTWTDAQTYPQGTTVYADYYVNCSINTEDYELHVYAYSSSGGAWSDFTVWNWTETNSYEMMDDDWSNLAQGTYCVNATLYMVSGGPYQFIDFEVTCFTVTGNNNGGGGNTTLNPCGLNSTYTEVWSWMDASTYANGDDQDATFYVNCTRTGSDYTLEYYVSEVGSSNYLISGMFTWVATSSNINFYDTFTGLGPADYCVLANLYEANVFLTDNGGTTCFTVLPGNNTGGNNTGGNNTGGNNTGGNNTGGNNTWSSNATLDVELAHHQWAGSYDTEQWMMVDQMNSGATYEVVWTLDTCNGFNWMDSGTWSFTGVANQAITDFSVQPGWNCLVLEGELFENGNPVDWDMDTIWCNCSNGLNTTSPANNTPPQVSSVMISPSWATETDVLTCTYVYYDFENDPDMSTITWTISGVPTTTVGPTLSSGYVAGDFVTCVVSSFDGTDYGNVGSTTSLIMTNSSGSSGGGGIPSVGIVGTIAAISAGFIFAIRREDEE